MDNDPNSAPAAPTPLDPIWDRALILADRGDEIPTRGAKPPQRLNHRHEGILRWLLANPDKQLQDCCAELGYTQAWLSTIIHSHAFQAELRARQLQLYGEVALEIKDKLTGAAHLALDKIIEHLPVASPQFALDAAKETLKNLGYSAPRNGHGTNININTGPQYNVSPDELARARAIMQAKQHNAQPALEHNTEPTTAAA